MHNYFITNQSKISFLDKIITSLRKCKSFYFSVSFIKYAGLSLIDQEIENTLRRGATGRIITSTYQNFTDIASLKKLLILEKEFKNFMAHIDFQCFGENGFHTKGYLFEYDEGYEFIIGSTNITKFAILKNIEWNVSIDSVNIFESYIDAKNAFEHLWIKTMPLSQKIIDDYSCLLDYAIEKWDMDYFNPNDLSIKPNYMQRKALKEISRYRDLGVSKALIISATGSGKTYLAAFDARNFDAKKLLFIVHRDTILIEALKSFEKVFCSTRSYAIYNNNINDLEYDFIFASNIMVANHLNFFNKEYFDYIVIDECHHASASTYKKIIEYFKPSFLLGLTATPERLDNESIFELFEHNVPFELRLRDAIVNDVVVPFHYYGIRDKIVDYSYEDNILILKEISKKENVNYISNQIKKYKDKGKLKCIAFCVSILHSKTMADQFNEIGYESIALTGDNSTGERIKAFADLQDDNKGLEIICTVDILNEGVDIPQVNMVLFLRPTESSTVFIQQLGRGLRKYPGKEYATILDFIGNNYDRSVQMAMAFGSLGRNSGIDKPYLRQLIANNFKELEFSGITINIDDLSREEVLKYIDKTNFNKINNLKKDYENFKMYLKKESFPSHMDFLNSDCSPDLIRFIKSNFKGKNKSYYTFLKKIGEKNLPDFCNEQMELIDYLSDLLPLTRPDEYIIIKQLIESDNINFDSLINYNNRVTKRTLDNAFYYLQKDKIVIDYKLNIKSISNEYRDYLDDLLEYGLSRCSIEFGEFNTDFKIYSNYTKAQVMMELLKKSKMCVKGTQIEGDTTYCFVGLQKDKIKSERLLYKDKFISKYIFQWESENNTTFYNNNGIKLINTKVVHLFIRKVEIEDGITKPFTYFGTGHFENVRMSSVYKNTMNEKLPTLLFDIVLDNPVDDKLLFDFEISKDIIKEVRS